MEMEKNKMTPQEQKEWLATLTPQQRLAHRRERDRLASKRYRQRKKERRDAAEAAAAATAAERGGDYAGAEGADTNWTGGEGGWAATESGEGGDEGEGEIEIEGAEYDETAQQQYEEEPPLPVEPEPNPPRLFFDPSDTLAELYEKLDKSVYDQEDAIAEVAEARRNYEDARKWLYQAEEQLRMCADDVRARTKEMWEGELEEPCEWNFMYARLRNYDREKAHKNINHLSPFVWEAKDTSGMWRKRKEMATKRDEPVDKRSRLYGSEEEQEHDGDELTRVFHSLEGNEGETKDVNDDGIFVDAEEESEEESDESESDEDDAERKDEEQSDKSDSGEDNVDDNERELGQWLEQQRNSFRSKRMKVRVPHRVRALEELGVVWNWGEARWKAMYDRLVQYKRIHGHIEVPYNYSAEGESDAPADGNCVHQQFDLHNWLNRQYSHYHRGNMKSEYLERVSALEELGIEWDRKNRKYDAMWAKMYRKLVQFQRLHGHTRVPKVPDHTLYKWAKVQRKARYYLNLKQMGQLPLKSSRGGEIKTNITPERVHLLEDISFDWDSYKPPKSWEDHFANLLAFREAHGHCDVPRRYEHKQLGEWVHHQRKYLSLKLRGNPLGQAMTEERKRRLDAVGFSWCLKKKGRWGWEERFGELLAFKAQFGHMTVPRAGEHKTLGLWIKKQKGYARRYERGEEAPIEEDQIEKLINIGVIDWKPTAG